jgi:CHASE3 domain sensor protein
MREKAFGWILAFFFVITAILIVVGVQAVRSINRSVTTSDWVNHTHAVVLETEELRGSLYLASDAWSRYLLTNEPRDLAACREALSNLTDHLEIIEALTRREPVQYEEIKQLESQVNRRADFIQGVVAARQNGKAGAAGAMLSDDAGGTAVRDIERQLEKLKNEELTLLTERDSASYLQAQTTRWTVWTGVMLDVLILGGVAILIRDDLAARRRVAAALKEANDQLEVRVRERTAELSSANEQLSAENLERQWANQAIEHQLRYNQVIIDSIHDSVIVITKTMKISRVNSALVHLTGQEPTELTNQPLSRIVRLVAADAGTASPMLDPVLHALKEGRDLRDEPAIVEDKRGRQTSVRFSLIPLRDRNKIVGGIVTLQHALA